MNKNEEDSEEVKVNLISLLNRLKIFRGEEFKAALSELTSLIKNREIPPEVLGEVLGGFIVERCDNMLANIPILDNIREYIHKLSLEAYKLYLYSVMRGKLRNDDTFIKYVVEFPEGVKVESNSLNNLMKVIRKEVDRRLKKELSNDGVKLISNIIIDSENQLKEFLPIIFRALSKRTIKLMLLPNTDAALRPLFFKEYYLSTRDYVKVKNVAISLDRIVKAVKPYLTQDSIAYEYISNIERLIRCILGGESLDKYFTKEYISYSVRLSLEDDHLNIKLLSNGKEKCSCRDWGKFQECLRSSLKVNYLITHCIIKKLYEDILLREDLQERREITVSLNKLLSECIEEDMGLLNK